MGDRSLLVRKYAARVDGNHAEIVAALLAIGCDVEDCSRVGGGFPDIWVMWRGQHIPLEIKDGAKPPSARGLTAAQAIFHARAAAKGCRIPVVTSVDEAIAAVSAATLTRGLA